MGRAGPTEVENIPLSLGVNDQDRSKYLESDGDAGKTQWRSRIPDLHDSRRGG